MPAYNTEKYIGESIESILRQTYQNFEFIIINDGSIDSTEKIIESYNDPRIVYLKNNTNKGLSYSFNFGISKAQGYYIARMDSDDIALETRLETQVKYLDKNTKLDIVGSSAILINENGERIGVINKPKEHVLIKWQSLFSTPLVHPTVMGKAAIFKNNPYNESLVNSEDYELWSRLFFSSRTKFGNIRKPLLKYRVYSKSFTQNLDTSKRMASTLNAISNIEHYEKLTSIVKNFIIEIHQNKKISIKNIFTLWLTYCRVARSFAKKEEVTMHEYINIQLKLINQLWFLFKYFIRNIRH